MKIKYLSIFLLMWSILSVETSADESQAAASSGGKLDCLLATTLQSTSLDWWFAVPSNTGPQLNLASEVFRGQKLCILPLVHGYALDAEKNFDLEYDLTVRYPDGKVKPAAEKIPMKGFAANPQNIELPKSFAVFVFEQSDPDGLYEFALQLRDKVSGKQISKKRSIKLLPWSALDEPVLDKEKLKKDIFTYYRAPDARRLWQAFLSEDTTFWQNDAPDGINYAVSSFYKNAFSVQPDLFGQLVAYFGKATPKQRLNIIHLDYLLGENKISDGLLSDEERSYRNQLKNLPAWPDPYKAIAHAGDLDVLWGEFFATGDYRPIRRLVDAFEYASFLNAPASDKAGQYKSAIFKAALWSLQSNAERIELVRQYLGCVLETEGKKLPGSSRKVLWLLLQKIWPERYSAPSGNEPKTLKGSGDSLKK